MSPTALWPRSFLYAPGHRADILRKALDSGADAVIADLEDAVPATMKDQARSTIRAQLEEPFTSALWIRVDPTTLEADLDVAVHPATAGIFLAKSNVRTLARAITVLDRLEIVRRLSEPLTIIPVVESALALSELARLAGSPRVAALSFGEVDLLADLRVNASSSRAVETLRLTLVVQSVAAGLHAPIGPTSLRLRDPDEVLRTTGELVALGYRSRTAIHPSQIDAIHIALSPTGDDITKAREILNSSAEAGGGGIRMGDRFVDDAVLRDARETLERSRAAR